MHSSGKVILLVFALCAGGAALAGNRMVYPVRVDQVARTASGGLRNDNPATLGTIGCHVGPALGTQATGTTGGGCVATQVVSANSTTVGSCFTTTNEHLATLRALNEDSYVSFFWDADGNCTGITTIIGSQTPPAIGTTQVGSGPVLVNTTEDWARGDVGGTRNSSDNVQWIQCQVRAQLGVSSSARCSAQMADGTRADCDTRNSQHLRNIGALNSTSQLYFEWINEAPLVGSDGAVFGVLGTCSAVRVETATHTATKLP